VANSAQRHGFTSQEIIRNADGSFDVTVGPRARPGNWLPTGGVEKYLLVLRLYDTPIGMAKVIAGTLFFHAQTMASAIAIKSAVSRVSVAHVRRIDAAMNR